jgi:hypothetical protein
MAQGDTTQLRRTCYEMKKEGFNLRLPIRRRAKLGLFPSASAASRKTRREKVFGSSELRFIYAPHGPRAWRYSELSLCFLSYTFRGGVKRRMREEHFVPEG